MKLTLALSMGIGLSLIGGIATADGHSTQGPRVYAYKSHANYCPAGLQPVTISGVICCGTPNQKMSYQQMLAHPAGKKRQVRHVRRARANCEIGTKGCTFD